MMKKLALGLDLFQPAELHAALPEIARLGFAGVELPFELFSAISPKDVGELAGDVQRANLAVAAVGIGPLDHNRKRLKAACLSAKQWQAQAVYCVAPSRSGGHWRHFLQAARWLQESASALGMRALLHPRPGTLVQSPEDLDRYLALGDGFPNLLFDTAEYNLFDADLPAALGRYLPRIGHVHLKDMFSTPSEVMTPRWQDSPDVFKHVRFWFADLGRGCVANQAAVATLRQAGYQGWLSVELEVRRFSYPLDHAREDYRVLAQWTAEPPSE